MSSNREADRLRIKKQNKIENESRLETTKKE